MDSGTLKFDEKGLVTVVAVDAETGELRMLAHANQEAIDATLRTGQAHFWSRSRGKLWKKGEESGNTLAVSGVFADCDADAVLYKVTPNGPTCHTGAANCFFQLVSENTKGSSAPTLVHLERELQARADANAEKSYTKSLLQGGPEKIGEKINEEAAELAQAIANESDERVASEMADLLYHAMVGLLSRGVPVRAALEVLSARFGVSGHDEKASRVRS
ncbi:MAG: bifunctional phosphoribosyl-AMP cyclohydrolase/phosphoribosyl-ATP diphosphatase HisIE [Polyangiales bacterium]